MTMISRLFLFYALPAVASFSAPTKPAAPWQNFLDSFVRPSSNANSNSRRIVELKERLLAECRANVGRSTPAIRGSIEDLIGQLTPLNPTPRTATSPLLRKRWVLEWTTEKEINFFLEKGLSERITQTIDGDGVLENDIPFVNGGRFAVTGELSVDEEREGLMRTRFKFRNANLDVGKWGNYNFPPVGQGWFDTIYLDEDLRIDTNSRDDILICRADG